jgi:hypothetical protein
MVELDVDAFKVEGKYGKPRSDAAARMGKCRAVNEFVNTILGDYFSVKYTPKQLVLALRLSSQHPDVRMLFKSAGLTDVEDLEALRFHNEQIHRILKTTNDTKNKGGATDDVRSYEQSVYSSMAESPVSSNSTGKVPTMNSRAKLFPDIPKRTALRGMCRGKLHRKNMRDSNVSFSRVMKRLGRTKVSVELEEAFLKWLDNHNMVIQSPLASDTLLVSDPENPGNKKRMNKILLQIPVRELHNDLLSTDPLIGLSGVRDCSGNILISDTKLRSMLPKHLRMMSDRYKIMCGCENCIQMYNLHSSYNRFIGYRIKDLEDKLSKLNPRTRNGKEAQLELNNYRNKVKPNGEHRFPNAKDAMFCCLCSPPDEEYQSLHKLDCVLGECESCPGYDRPPEELEMDNDISFHWYDTLPSCSIHNMLPKYPTEVEGVTLVQTKSCRACDLEQERDKKYVRGGFYKRKYLTKKKVPFQIFYKEYYLKQLKKYTYHRFLKIILCKSNTEDIRLERLRPGEAIGSRDYAERLLMKFHLEIQSEHFGAGRDLSIEGNVVKNFPVGANQTKTHFYSFLKDSKIQNAATTDKHMDRLIKILKKRTYLKIDYMKLPMDVVLNTDRRPHYGFYLHYLQSIIL